MSDNRTTFIKGMKRAQEVIYSAIDAKFIRMAKKLFDALCKDKFYLGYTGNTQRSYTAAYFLDGELRYMVQGKDVWTAREIRKKVKYEEQSYLKEPYEGGSRGVKGAVEVDDYYGWKTALDFVMQHRSDKGWQIIVAVGTEYYLCIPNNPWESVEEEMSFHVEQDALMEHFVKQVSGLVSMKLN